MMDPVTKLKLSVELKDLILRKAAKYRNDCLVDLQILKWMRRKLKGREASIPELLEIYRMTIQALDGLLEIRHAHYD